MFVHEHTHMYTLLHLFQLRLEFWAGNSRSCRGPDGAREPPPPPEPVLAGSVGSISPASAPPPPPVSAGLQGAEVRAGRTAARGFLGGARSPAASERRPEQQGRSPGSIFQGPPLLQGEKRAFSDMCDTRVR